MNYELAKNKEISLKQISELVSQFENAKDSYLKATYNETQLRNDFLDPFLKSFGWDVQNEKASTQFLRDVVQEESIEIEESSAKKNPDYTLRVGGLRKLFVEAKKPSVNIINSAQAAFQTRRYGWNGNLGVSLLTNFDKLIIYDCRYRPDISDDSRIARFKVFQFSDYVEKHDEIYSLLSYESVSNGVIDELFSTQDEIGQTFDEYFLMQIENWRSNLANSAISRNKDLTNQDINFLIQRLLNRIIFLRICEDRSIETYETLKGIESYDELKKLFRISDKKYNSGLFDFIEDNLTMNIELDSQALINVFNELYYPLSPYDFKVVDPAILSQIYEKFLGSRLEIEEDRQLSLVQEPEVVASNGVVPTPKMIVEKIVRETLEPLLFEKSLDQIFQLKIADICCGSGTFLISVYDYLLQAIIEKCRGSESEHRDLVLQVDENTLALTLNTKKKLLLNTIHGVDINPYAVEVTKFSLLLKLLEDENSLSVEHYIDTNNDKVLPDLSSNIKCGNSLVDNKFFEFSPDAINDNDTLYKVKPFQWEIEFSFVNTNNGFDAIVGNPPYVRIQNLVQYASEEIKYYQSDLSGYEVARNYTIDKYYVFIQRAIELLNNQGRLGYIVPHKFFIVKGGKALRQYIIENSKLSKIIHFGATQVFPERSTYSAIIILDKGKVPEFEFKRLKKVTPEVINSSEGFIKYNQSNFNTDPWIFLSKEVSEIFNKIKSNDTTSLSSLTEISVGLQTSADHIYIFTPINETENVFQFEKNGIKWGIEKTICLPCIYDLSFELFDSISPNAQIIFPYHFNDSHPKAYSEEELSENYPLCLEYLLANKDSLENRSINGKDPKWYEFGRRQSLSRFHDNEKLVWPVLSKEPSYVLDKKNIQFTGGGNGPYYSLINPSNYSIEYILGIISHPLFECMVKAGASEFRGAYYSHGKQFIANLPIKEINFEDDKEKELYENIVTCINDSIKTKDDINKSYGANRQVLSRKLDMLYIQQINLINELYEITEEQYHTVIHDDMFTKELIEEN